MFFKIYQRLWQIALTLAHVCSYLSPKLKTQLKERTSSPKKTGSNSHRIWLHCASLGEAKGLLGALLALDFKDRNLLITSTTQAAVQFLRSHQNKLTNCNHTHIQLAPFDYQPMLRCWFTHFKISSVVIYEMELWPGMLKYCSGNKIPVYWIGARFTKKARRIYLRFPKLFSDVTQPITWVQTPGNKNHIPIDQNKVSGGTDYKIPWFIFHSVKAATNLPDSNQPQKVGGLGFLSLHYKELNPLAEFIAWAAANYKVLIFPRYIAHSHKFLKKLEGLGFKLYSRSPQNRLLIVDSLGKIPQLSPKFEVSIIGGSFCKLGGHTFWESFALNKYSVCGPSCWAQAEAFKLLRDAGLATQVWDSRSFISNMENLKPPASAKYASLKARLLKEYRNSSKELAKKLKVKAKFEARGALSISNTKVLQEERN